MPFGDVPQEKIQRIKKDDIYEPSFENEIHPPPRKSTQKQILMDEFEQICLYLRPNLKNGREIRPAQTKAVENFKKHLAQL